MFDEEEVPDWDFYFDNEDARENLLIADLLSSVVALVGLITDAGFGGLYYY